MSLKCPNCGCRDVPFDEEFEHIGACRCSDCGHCDLAEGFEEDDGEDDLDE